MTRVSVIIPAHNAERYLAQAIKSVAAQTHRDHEIVVVNDGSTDGTRGLMDAFGDTIVAVHQENMGASAARNAGVAASTGEHLAFLDADDWLFPDTLSELSRLLDAHPGVGLVAGGLDVVDENGQYISTQKPWLHCPTISIDALTMVGLSGPTGVMVRRANVLDIGGFDTTLTHVEDIDFWWRLKNNGCHMTWLGQTVGCYRVHGGSLSQAYLLHHEKRIALLDRHLASGVLEPSVVAHRSQVVARIKVALAGRLFSVGDSESGTRTLEDAIALDPGLLTPDAIAELIANWHQDVRIANPDRTIKRALANLPIALSWLAKRQHLIDRFRWQYRFYIAALETDRAGVVNAWLNLAKQHPRWLLNRGGWSILRRSYPWHRDLSEQ